MKARTPIRRVSKLRGKQRGEYLQARDAFLATHFLCQVTLRENGIPEDHALLWGVTLKDGVALIWHGTYHYVPVANQVHHRNKRNGSRLTDTRWFLAVSREMHDKIESNKSWARERGYLLDISADPDGRTPSGMQALTTDELMGLIK